MSFLYDALIKPFSEGEWFIGCFMWLIALVVAFVILVIVVFIWDEIDWARRKPIEISVKNISSTYKESTMRTHSVPVVTGKGVGMGVVCTGEYEKFVTVWYNEKYGRLVYNDEWTFRYADKINYLEIKDRDNGSEVRIVSSGWK